MSTYSREPANRRTRKQGHARCGALAGVGSARDEPVLALQRIIGNRMIAGLLSAEPLEEVPFDDPHFATLGAKKTAALYTRLVPFEFIVTGDSPDVEKWTNPELDALVKTLWEDTAEAHRSLYRGISVVKNVVSNSRHHASWTGQNQLIINQTAFDHGASFLRMVVQHELGHGVEQAHPGTAARFGRLLRVDRQLATAATVRAVCGAFADQALESLERHPRSPEEYFCSAYAARRIYPDRLPEAMRAWFDAL